jgi:hypothetical protein
MRSRIARLCCALFLGVGPAWPCIAESPRQEQRLVFDIPAQPLASALEAFSAASGYQILMAEAASGSMVGNAVKGLLLPREALSRMLGAGLKAQFTGDRAAIIVRDLRGTSATVSSRTDGDYDAALQSAAIAVLCRNAATRPGTYRAALDLWISRSGSIERAELLHTTGDTERDHLIVAALHALNATPPPQALEQPTTLLVLPATASVQICEPRPSSERASTQ